VCIISDEQDHWSIAYNTFILAKQAGIDVEFQYETQPVKDAALYLVPSIRGNMVVNRHRWQELLSKVKEGAALYISHENGLLDRFEDLSGVRVETRERRNGGTSICMDKLEGNPVFYTSGPFRLKLNAVRAEVLGTEEDGNPAFTCADYGKGKVYFLSFPMESELANRPGSYDPGTAPYYGIYKHIAAGIRNEKAVIKGSPFVGVTEHPIDSCTRIVVAVNYRPEAVDFVFSAIPGWKPSDVFYGGAVGTDGVGFIAGIPGADALVFLIIRD
ncbi:MAG: hypothetical protein Q7J78_01615, partial [Clostridiales bacterium]|nr:hypothetical protein [Clostridiales bacterium]